MVALMGKLKGTLLTTLKNESIDPIVKNTILFGNTQIYLCRTKKENNLLLGEPKKP